MRARHVLVLPLCVYAVCESAQAGWSGSTEFRWRLDSSRFEQTERALEQWTGLNYLDLSSGLASGVQFSLEGDGDDWRGRLYQAYLRSGDGYERPELTVGRFEAVDSSGYQTLDGVALRQRFDAFDFNLRAGKPRRFEAYESDASDLLLSASGDYDLLALWPLPSFERISLNLGMERQWSASLQTRLLGGLSGVFREREQPFSPRDFHLAFVRDVDDERWYRLIADGRFGLGTMGMLRLGYAYYDPDEAFETFRDRYHGFYSLERQTVTRAIWQLPAVGGVNTQLEFYASRPEAGAQGWGWSVEMDTLVGRSHRLDTRIDATEADEDHAYAVYVRDRLPLSPLMEMSAEGVYQTKQTGLSGENHLWGVSLSASRLIFKQTRLCLRGEWLDHSVREREYRLDLALHYDFYQIDTGELP